MNDGQDPSIEQRIAHLRKLLRLRRGRGPRRWFESPHSDDELQPLPITDCPSAEWAETDWPQTEWPDTISELRDDTIG